jgi:hypothetical protein
MILMTYYAQDTVLADCLEIVDTTEDDPVPLCASCAKPVSGQTGRPVIVDTCASCGALFEVWVVTQLCCCSCNAAAKGLCDADC